MLEKEEALGGGVARRRRNGKDSGILFPFPKRTSSGLLPGSPRTARVVGGESGPQESALQRTPQRGAEKKAENLEQRHLPPSGVIQGGWALSS